MAHARPFEGERLPSIAEAELFPAGGPRVEQLFFLLRYAVLAPSTHNTQPWKFAVTPEGISVFADYTRRMPVVDPGNRELLMSVGAAIMNLRVAMAHFGIPCGVHLNLTGASDQPIAVLTAEGEAPDHALASLFPAITRRHTNRGPFLLSRIPASVLRLFDEAVTGAYRVALTMSVDGRKNDDVAALIAAADQILYADAAYRKDLAEWVRPNWSDRTDGMSAAAVGLHGLAATLGPWTTRVLDTGRLRSARDRNLCLEAPGLLVLSGDDDVPSWLETGELLERLLLTATGASLHHSYFNMPVQVPDQRLRLKHVLGTPGLPQLLLRIGFSLDEPVVTPRRPLDDMLIAGMPHTN
jgi:hypothetical protein